MTQADDVQKLMAEYREWLAKSTTVRDVGDWAEVTTPFLDRHNDHLQFYVRLADGGWEFTDDGYIIRDLRSSGCELDTPKRSRLLASTLNGFGVKRDRDALVATASRERFSQKKHAFVQAMLAINDLYALAEPHVASLFSEDVEAWLNSLEVRFSTRLKVTGRSGNDHVFDFVIPKSRSAPERLVRTITRPSVDTAEAVAFQWIDTRDVRPDARAYAILNDVPREPAAAVEATLREYEVSTLRWSRRDEFAALLTA